MVRIFPAFRELEKSNKLYRIALEGIHKSPNMDFKFDILGWEWTTKASKAGLTGNERNLIQLLNELALKENEFGENGKQLNKYLCELAAELEK